MTENLGALIPVLRSITCAVGSEVMVIGAHARDVVLREWGVGPGTATEDLDVVVMLPAGAEYSDIVSTLGPPMNSMGIRFNVAGVRVDILPAIQDIERAAIFSPVRDIHIDVRGQYEAYAAARIVSLADSLTVRVPTAHALVLLKLIAWEVRGAHTPKDAHDLRLILDAVSAGLDRDARVWDEEALLRDDFDAESVKWRLVGREAAASMPETAGTAAGVIARHRHALPYAMGLLDPLGLLAGRLRALEEGLSST